MSSSVRFDRFHERTSRAAGYGTSQSEDRMPFVPDWLDSLAHRIATADLVEATAGWVIFRANGNQCECAIHIYGNKGGTLTETPLNQRDCALEIAWLQSGHRREWLDAPLQIFRAEAAKRGIRPIDKTSISHAITANRQRGVIAQNTGHRLVPVPRPQKSKVADSPENFRQTRERSRDYHEFLEWAKVAYSSEFVALEVARSEVERMNKFFLSLYKKWRSSRPPETNGEVPYKQVENDQNPPPVSNGCPQPTAPHMNEEEDNSNRLVPTDVAVVITTSPSEQVNISPPFAVPAAEAAPNYATLKRFYPKHRFDDPKTRRLFNRLAPERQARVIDRLRLYLRCDRWVTDGGRWIPFSSNWLPACDADPPPRFCARVDQESERRQRDFEQALRMMDALAGAGGAS